MSVLIQLLSVTLVALCATGVAVCTLRAWALRPQGLSFDETGERIGEPIIRPAPARALTSE